MDGTPPTDTGAMVQSAEQPAIGQAQMTPDRTIVLDLRAQDGQAMGIGRLVYPKEHPQYFEILNHLGGMEPGEIKLVKPWP